MSLWGQTYKRPDWQSHLACLEDEPYNNENFLKGTQMCTWPACLPHQILVLQEFVTQSSFLGLSPLSMAGVISFIYGLSSSLALHSGFKLSRHFRSKSLSSQGWAVLGCQRMAQQLLLQWVMAQRWVVVGSLAY